MTIGYGHTRGVRHGDKITEDYANELLREDMVKLLEPVYDSVKNTIVFSRATEDSQQFMLDALICFAFNVGYKAFETSGLLRQMDNEDITTDDLKRGFMRWVHSGDKELPGLVERRELEYNLFLGKFSYILDDHGRPMPAAKAGVLQLQQSVAQSGFRRLKGNLIK